MHTRLRYMIQGKSPCTAARCHFLPDAIVSLIATELALSTASMSSLEPGSCERLENKRDVHLGENWTLSDNGETRRMCSFPVFFPNRHRRLSCVWFEIVKRIENDGPGRRHVSLVFPAVSVVSKEPILVHHCRAQLPATAQKRSSLGEAVPIIAALFGHVTVVPFTEPASGNSPGISYGTALSPSDHVPRSSPLRSVM